MEFSEFNKWEKIAGIIAGEVTGELTPEEENELNTWLKEPDNAALYKRIRNSANYQEWNATKNKFETKSDWENLSHSLKLADQRNRWVAVLKYAAIIIFPLMMAGGLYLFSLKNINKEQTAYNQPTIKPGSSKAVLFLNDGKSVELDNSEKLTIKESDGTIIHKLEGMLDYSVPGNKESDLALKNKIDIPGGGEYKLVLSDGTRMNINSVSQLSYPVKFPKGARIVELKGEAYFEVAHDTKKPFIVKTAGIEIEVLGTSFNINSYEGTGKVITTLAEGQVRIKYAGNSKSIDLNPDEQAVFYTGNGNIVVEKVDASLYTAWKNGEFVFRDQRLEDIMITLARWYSVNVDFVNPDLKNIRFSGSLNRYGEITPILDIIGSTGKASFELNQNNIIFRDKK